MSQLRSLRWPLLVVSAVLVLLSQGLAPGWPLAWRDALREYAPLRPMIAEALRHGELPLWDPFDGTGTPLFAQLLHGVLHPASVALALLAPGTGLEALLVAYVVLAALGAFLAARAFDAEPCAAAVAALGYAGSGPVLANLAYPPFLAGAATMPWLVAAARRAGLGLPMGTVGAALATAAMIFSGDLQACVVVVVVGLAVAWAAGRARGAGRLLVGVAVGALLGGVQLVPSWHFLQRTLRAWELSPEVQRQWALSPWRLQELVAPGFFAGLPGTTAAPVFMALDGPTRFTLPYLSSVFLGVGLLAAAGAGVTRRAVRPIAVAAAILLWLAVGHHLGAQQLLRGVPIWGQFRYAEKLLVPLALCVALLASSGAQALRDAPPGRWAGLIFPAAMVAPPLLGLAASLALGGRLPAAVLELARAQLGTGLIHLCAGLLGLGLALWLARRRSRLFLPALLALVFAEALAASPFALGPGAGVLPSPPSPPAPPPGVRLLTPVRGGVRADDPRGHRLTAELDAALGYPGHNVWGRVDNLDIYSGLVSRRFEGLWERLEEGRWRAYRRYAVTHVALPSGSRQPSALEAREGGTLVSGDGRVEVWSVPHRSWATFAPAVKAEPRQRETLTLTVANLRSERPEVVLETAEAPPVAAGRVVSVRREAELVEVEAEAEGAAVLVVNDAYWPGWVARVDGRRVPILPADVLVRAVPFPAGRHRLVMTYEPPEVAAGLWCGAAGLAALTALALRERRRRHNAASSSSTDAS